MEASPAKTHSAKLLFGAAMASLLVAYLLAVHLPNRRLMTRLQSELELKRQTMQVAALADEMARSKQGIEKATNYLQAVRGPSSKTDTGRLFGDISAIARQAGVRTKRFDPSPAIEHDALLQLPLAIECDGSFEQIFAVLNQFEALPQLIWISSLHLHSEPSQQGELHCKVNLEVFADKRKISD
jgi:Tfp pilus assembly protein PilO